MRKEISTCHHLNINLSSWKFQSIIMKISAIHNKTRPVIIKISIWLRENLELSSWNSRPITKKISTVQNTLNKRTKYYVKSVCILSYSGLHFPHLDWLRRDTSLCIHSECQKMRTRITPNTDTFHAVFRTVIMKISTAHNKILTCLHEIDLDFRTEWTFHKKSKLALEANCTNLRTTRKLMTEQNSF